MGHSHSPEAEAILDKEYKVLDKGFIRLVDYMGNDSRIVQSARVSYGEGTKSYREDAALIDYLLRNGHTSPFEQVVFTFHCKMPLFVARQWIRHRTARVNEISGRYSIMREEFYQPQLEDIAKQSANNKQGRGEPLAAAEAEAVARSLEAQQRQAYEEYKKIIDAGVAKELARMNLPLSLYTEWYWQIDLNNLFHFLKLRLDAHAQMEIRRYAEVLLQIAGRVVPAAVKSFKEHVMEGICLSKSEINALLEQVGANNINNINLDERSLNRLKEKISKY
jgi:thymidylate synthase (FAD)